MTFETVDLGEFLDFRLGSSGNYEITLRKNSSVLIADEGNLLSSCYQDPISGNGYSIYREGDEIIARAWNSETIIEYRGKCSNKRESQGAVER